MDGRSLAESGRPWKRVWGGRRREESEEGGEQRRHTCNKSSGFHQCRRYPDDRGQGDGTVDGFRSMVWARGLSSLRSAGAMSAVAQ